MLALMAAVTQMGFGAAAWRLAKAIDRRQNTHEEKDDVFQGEVRQRLGIPQPEKV